MGRLTGALRLSIIRAEIEVILPRGKNPTEVQAKALGTHERLMDSTAITVEKKKELTEKYNRLNPFQLKTCIERKLRHIWDTRRRFEEHTNSRALAQLSHSHRGNIPT